LASGEDSVREVIDGYSNHKKMEKILDNLKNKIYETAQSFIIKDSIVMDYGCGSGRYLEMFRNVQLVGVDSNNIVLEKITKNKIPSAKLLCLDLTNKEQTNNLIKQYQHNIDFLYSTIVLQHIPRSKIKQFFKGIASLVKKNGGIAFAFPTSLDFYERYGEAYYIRYSDVEIRKILLKNNFLIKKLEITNNGKDAYIVAIKQ
jgi:SAM-dependent methyltransferase